MSLDVAALAASGQTIMAAAIQSSGTAVTVLTDPDDTDSTIDFDTLEVTDPTPEAPAAADLPVLITVEGVDTIELGRERQSRQTVYRLLFLPSVTTVAEGSTVQVTSCRNPALVGARLAVFEVVDDGLNVVLTVRARRA